MMILKELDFKTKPTTYDEIRYMVFNGKVKIGSQLFVQYQGKLTGFSIIGVDVDEPVSKRDNAHYVTLQHYDLLDEERQFDLFALDGNNKWRDCSLRAYLNSEEYLSQYDEEFRSHLVPVVKYNNTTSATVDTFFILSKDEVTKAETIYPCYENERNRVKFASGNKACWYWLRTALPDSEHITYTVYSNGEFSHNYAHYPRSFAPACVMEVI